MDCPICHKRFYSDYNVKRHLKNKHGEHRASENVMAPGAPGENGTPGVLGAPGAQCAPCAPGAQCAPGELCAPFVNNERNTDSQPVYLHPFTMTISGPTGKFKFLVSISFYF